MKLTKAQIAFQERVARILEEERASLLVRPDLIKPRDYFEIGDVFLLRQYPKESYEVVKVEDDYITVDDIHKRNVSKEVEDVHIICDVPLSEFVQFNMITDRKGEIWQPLQNRSHNQK